VILAPQPAVIDELSALLLQDGWPANSMPNASQPWIDVTPDECISQPGVCKAHWDTLGLAGTLLSVVVFLCILIPAGMDWKVDRQIREVRSYWEAREERQKELNRLVA